MKRMKSIGSMFFALLFTVAGAGLVLASEDTFKFDFSVTFEGQTVGTLTIDAKHQTFDLSAKGLPPDTTYYLVCDQLHRSLGSAEAGKKGTVRMKEAWDPSFWDDLTETPTFVLSIAPPVGGVGCIPTKLTVTFYTIGLWGNVHGKLTEEIGVYNPVSGMDIRITDGACSGAAHTVAFATTNSDGEYSYTRFFWLPECAWPGAHFDGYGPWCRASEKVVY